MVCGAADQQQIWGANYCARRSLFWAAEELIPFSPLKLQQPCNFFSVSILSFLIPVRRVCDGVLHGSSALEYVPQTQ